MRRMFQMFVTCAALMCAQPAVPQETKRGIVPLTVAPKALIAPSRRVALVIGQNAYHAGLKPLANPSRDARAVADMLTRHGVEVIRCGDAPGCFDLTYDRFNAAIATFEQRAVGASLAIVFFAGHGLDGGQGNILTPTDARVDCASASIAGGVSVERVLAATRGARSALIVLDSCRDDPIGILCPGLREKAHSFARIEPGARQSLLVVTSTQFGAQALDGAPGAHSPFATAFLKALDANPSIYFEQVLNVVARDTHTAAELLSFRQIPGKVVGGAAPEDCLAGKSCVGDERMAALAIENERLAADAAGVRNLLADEERTRGKPYSAEERAKRVAELEATLKSIASSTDPKRQEAQRLIRRGDVKAGEAKLEEALDDDEKAIREAERVAVEKRKAAAKSAKDLAALSRGTDIAKSLRYYERATKLDPDDAIVWDAYARAAMDAGQLGVAKSAFEQSALKARDSGNPRQRYWATSGLGTIAEAEGNLASAQRLYETARAIVEPLAASDPGNVEWQRHLSVSQNNIGDIHRRKGDLKAALDAYTAALATRERLAKADPRNAARQRDLAVSHANIGIIFEAQGDFPRALESFRASLVIRERLAKSAPGNSSRQRDLSVGYNNVGDVLRGQGNLPAALDAYKTSLAISERLSKADPGNAVWQHDMSGGYRDVGDSLRGQGDLSAASEAYKAALAIADRLTKADHGNAGWQQHLALILQRIGLTAIRQGAPAEARAAYERGLGITQDLVKRAPDVASYRRDLKWFETALSRLK